MSRWDERYEEKGAQRAPACDTGPDSPTDLRTIRGFLIPDGTAAHGPLSRFETCLVNQTLTGSHRASGVGIDGHGVGKETSSPKPKVRNNRQLMRVAGDCSRFSRRPGSADQMTIDKRVINAKSGGERGSLGSLTDGEGGSASAHTCVYKEREALSPTVKPHPDSGGNVGQCQESTASATTQHGKEDDQSREDGQPSEDALVGDVSAVGRSTLSGRQSILQGKAPKEIALEVGVGVKVKAKIEPDGLEERR